MSKKVKLYLIKSFGAGRKEKKIHSLNHNINKISLEKKAMLINVCDLLCLSYPPSQTCIVVSPGEQHPNKLLFNAFAQN